ANCSLSLRTPMRNCAVIPWRAKRHHKHSERSRQVEEMSEHRAAARTIRAVRVTRDSVSGFCEVSFALLKDFLRDFCVARKPRSRKLKLSKERITAARKKSNFAGPGSELNR